MAYAESALGTPFTFTGGGFTTTVTTRIGTGLSTGWLLIVDVLSEYDLNEDSNDEPIALGCPAAIVHATGTVPSNMIWTLDNTQTVTQGDYSQQFRQYSAQPLDGSDLPIGSASAFMRLSRGVYDGNPNPGLNVSLAWHG